MKKVVLVNVSPRKGGNSDVIAARLAEKAKDAEIRTVVFRETPVSPCLACNVCKGKETPFCVQKDVMGELIPELDECDALVLVSPIYFGRLSGPAMLFIDRLYSFFAPDRENASNATKTGKKLALVSPCGAGPADVYTKYLEETAATFGVAGFTDPKVLVCGGVNARGEVGEHAEDMEKINEIAAWI